MSKIAAHNELCAYIETALNLAFLTRKSPTHWTTYGKTCFAMGSPSEPSCSDSELRWFDMEMLTAIDNTYGMTIPYVKECVEFREFVCPLAKVLMEEYGCRVEGSVSGQLGEAEEAVVERLRKIHIKAKCN